MVDPQRHREDRNRLESLALQIPGFKGYLEKEYRRDSDYLLRTALADRLQRSKPSLDGYMRNLLDAGQLDAMPQCERVRTRVDGLTNAIRSGERGYSGVFDYVKVNQNLLDQVYEHDLALSKDIETLAQAIEALASSTAPPTAAIPPILHQLDECDRIFAHRRDLLKGLGPETS